RIPEIIDSRVAQFAGYLIGDGHISRVKRHVGLTTGDEPQARAFVDLGYELFGLLATMRWDDGRWRVQLHSETLLDFLVEEIGFGLERKQRALENYVSNRQWFKKEKWEDEVVSIEHGRADVYDISVEGTHRYAAAGFINHNSFWHSKIMTEKALKDSEIVD